jgi:phosphoribosylglycinamide formyltransferase 1
MASGGRSTIFPSLAGGVGEVDTMAGDIRIGALISGGGSNLQAIINACESGRIDGRMLFVGSDNPRAAGLQRAAKHGIPSFCVDYGAIIRRQRQASRGLELPVDADLKTITAKQALMSPDMDLRKMDFFIRTRVVAEAQLLALMQAYDFDLLVLAGFMRNLSPYLIDRVNVHADRPRIMNIHPALLPSFAGLDGYGDTYRYGCKVGGCTVHFIDYGEDTGPIIGQRAFAISPDDTIESIRKKGLALEWELYPQCIQYMARGQLKTVRKTYQLPGGRCVERTVVQIET